MVHALVITGAAAVAVGWAGQGWWQDRMEDWDDRLEIEEKARIWRQRAWRHAVPYQQQLLYVEALGEDRRAIRPPRYNVPLEAALYGFPGASKVLHERELVWLQAGDGVCWSMATALLFHSGANTSATITAASGGGRSVAALTTTVAINGASSSSAIRMTAAQSSNTTTLRAAAGADPLADSVIISTRLAHVLQLTEGLGGPVHARLRPPSRSRLAALSSNIDCVAAFRFNIAGVVLTRPAVVRDVPEMGGPGNPFVALPRDVEEDLMCSGFRVVPFHQYHAASRR